MAKPVVISLYLNGLGDGTLRGREAWLFRRHAKKGIHVVTGHVNWRTNESFLHMRDRYVVQARELLKTIGDTGILVLNGSSAGVCLALAVRDVIDDARIIVIGHSGRIRAGRQARWDYRTMEWCAHLGKSTESRSFYEGVAYCERELLPRMSQDQKNRTLLTTPFACVDELVPASTMPIQGVKNVVVPVIGHVTAIGYGLWRMPAYLKRLNKH